MPPEIANKDLLMLTTLELLGSNFAFKYQVRSMMSAGLMDPRVCGAGLSFTTNNIAHLSTIPHTMYFNKGLTDDEFFSMLVLCTYMEFVSTKDTSIFSAEDLEKMMGVVKSVVAIGQSGENVAERLVSLALKKERLYKFMTTYINHCLDKKIHKAEDFHPLLISRTLHNA